MPVAVMVNTSNILGRAPLGAGEVSRGADRVREAHPGQLSYSSSGNGAIGASHARGFQLAPHRHLPRALQGSAAGMVDLIAGRVSLTRRPSPRHGIT